jgi:hypothetical protein
MPPPPIDSSESESRDLQQHEQHQHQLQQQQRLWRLHCMCATLADPCQDQENATGEGLLYFAEDAGGAGGGTWSVELPREASGLGHVGIENDVPDAAVSAAAAAAASSLFSSSETTAAAEASASEAFEAWDDVMSHDMSLSYWSSATVAQATSGAASAAAAAAASEPSSASLLAPGARAFLGLDFFPPVAADGSRASDSSSNHGGGFGHGGIAAVGLAFPGWGEFGGRGKGDQSGSDPWA